MSPKNPAETGRLLRELVTLFALPALLSVCASYLAPFVVLSYWQWFVVSFTAQWLIRASVSGATIRTINDDD